MTMGLIILGIFTLALFFDMGRNAFKGLGLSAWAAFFVIVAFAIGIIVPSIPVGGVLYMNVGGFILPVIAMFALLYIAIKGNSIGRAIVAMLAVVAVVTGLLFIMPMSNMGWIVLTSFVIGLISGASAFIIARSRIAAVFGILSGAVVGNIIYSLIDYFAITGGAFTLGGSVIYNSIFVAIMFVFVLAEAALRMGRATGESGVQRRNLNFEASEQHEFDEIVDEDEPFDSFDDELF